MEKLVRGKGFEYFFKLFVYFIFFLLNWGFGSFFILFFFIFDDDFIR